MTDLYRHYDDNGKLLYVGISKNTLVRLGQHEEHAHWFERISRVTIEKYPSRAAALEAERIAIHAENPLCNIQRRPPPEGTRDNKKSDRNAIASKSATALTQGIVWFNTAYTLDGIASHLSISVNAVKRLIESKAMGYMELEDRGRITRRVTGWQLIEFLESREMRATRQGGNKQ